MTDRQLVDITGLSKAAVLAALFNASAPGGLGFLQAQHGPDVMTEADAQQYIDLGTSPDPGSSGRGDLRYDYLLGRPLKLDLSGDSFDPWGFDRDNGGDGSAQKVIDQLRETNQVTSDEQQALTRDRTLVNAHEIMGDINTTSRMSTNGDVGVFELGNEDIAEPLEKAVDHVVERVVRS